MKKRSKTILTAILIGAALGISAGALSAYMTSSETATNTFTAGEVKIDLQEPAWKPEDGKHLVAKQTVLKDPKIKNTGKNPAYVFMTVQMPVRTLTLYNNAGRKEEYSETTELFNLKKNVNGNYETLSDTNSGNWVLLKDRSIYGTKDESFTTYVYAYRVPVVPNATSDALFDAVQLKNVIEGYSEMSKISTKDEYPITINGYAIQATDVIGADGSDVTNGTVTADDLLRMYDTYVNQNGIGSGSSMNLMTDPSTQYKDGKIVIPELPKKTGYKNDGLWHDDNGNTYAAGTEVTVTDEMKQNGFNLHVNWEPITYTVRFNSNGGSGTMEDLTMTYDEAATLPANAFANGAKFIGWSLSKTGSINFKDGAMVRNLSETDGDTVTLYALWKQNKFKVTYDANGGYFGTDTSKTTNTIVYHLTVDGMELDSGTELTPSHVEKYFGGWYTDADCTDGHEFSLSDCESNTTVYAKWRKPVAILISSSNGGSLNYALKKIAVDNKTITAFKRTEAMPDMAGMSDNNIISTDESETPIYCWREGTELKYWSKAGKIYSRDLDSLFMNFTYLNDISGLADFDTSKTPSMIGMFSGCKSLADLEPLSHWDTSNVSNMMAMFNACTKLNDLEPLSHWNTSNVKDMTAMFSECKSITGIEPLWRWNTSNVAIMEAMFNCCSGLTVVNPISMWDTSRATAMNSMFNGCTALTDVSPLSDWNTSNVINMSGMFYNCSSIQNIAALGMWDTSNVTDMSNMFKGCSNLQAIDGNVLYQWDTGKVTNMYNMFAECKNLQTIEGPLENWNTSNVTNMRGMFSECWVLTDLGPISSWDTNNVTNMNGMFSGCHSLTDISQLANWNISNVTDLRYAFSSCTSLTDLTPIANWNTSNVRYIEMMFRDCSSLVTIPTLNWDLKNVDNCEYPYGIHSMFQLCKSLKSIDGLAGWKNTGHITEATYAFANCENLENIEGLKNFDASSLANITDMFSLCPKLTNLRGLENWNTKSLKNAYRMFYQCKNLNDLSALKNWNTSNLNDSGKMFKETGITNLNGLENWDVRSVNSMYEMFEDCLSLTDATAINNWNPKYFIDNNKEIDSIFCGCADSIIYPTWNGTWSRGTFTPAA